MVIEVALPSKYREPLDGSAISINQERQRSLAYCPSYLHVLTASSDHKSALSAGDGRHAAKTLYMRESME